MTRPIEPPPPSRAHTPAHGTVGDRLDSWKEIAGFLRRDVRTVQRWEKQAGLPVHRHPESRLRTAFAYRSELEAWWRAHEAKADDDPRDVPTQGLWRRRWPVAVALGIAVLVTLIAASGRLHWERGLPAAPAPPLPITVLVARFEAPPADGTLAGALEKVVERELPRYGAIQIVAPSRVRRTLRLMRQSVETPVTAAIGREIAIRDGHIPVVLTGRLRRLASGFALDVDAVAAVDGSVRVSVEGQGKSDSELRTHLRRAVGALATGLNAEPRVVSGERLEPVTTGSLQALRLYSAAVQAGTRRQWRASELLARRALATDARLAAARSWIGWAMRQQGRPPAACLDASGPAVGHADDLSDREIYLIGATDHSIQGNTQAAIGALEALLRLQPADRLASDMLIDAYSRAGRVKDAVDLSVVRADNDPAAFYPNVRAAHALTVWQMHPARAIPFVARAQNLASTNPHEERPTWAAWLTGLPIFHLWLNDNSQGALNALAGVEHTLNGRLGRERDAYATMVGFSYLAFGRISDSSRAFRHAASPVRQINMAMQALAVGDKVAARRWLHQVRQHSELRPAMFARVGLLEEAERGLVALPPDHHAEGVTEITRGLIAARRRKPEAAEAALRRGVELLRFSGELEYFLGAEALSRLWMSRGETDRALNLLNDAAGQRARTYGSTQWTGGYWMKVGADLARSQRRAGDRQHAERLEHALAGLLSHADRGHPLRQQTPAVAARTR